MNDLVKSHVSARILDILKTNSRSTISEIASKVGVSRATAREKIDLMIEKGIIRRFTVELGDKPPSQDTLAEAIFEIKLTKSACRSVYQTVRLWPELIGCYSLAGDVDMIVILQAPEMPKLEALREKLADMPFVAKVQTRPVLKRWDVSR